MLPIVFVVVAVLFSFAFAISKKMLNFTCVTDTILYTLVFLNIGVMGIFGFIGNTFKGEQVAEQIGWPIGNPFQFEVGVANLAFGILGILSLFFRGSFIYAAIIGFTIFKVGAFIGHIILYIDQGMILPAGIRVFIWSNDLIIPILLGILAIISHHNKRS